MLGLREPDEYEIAVCGYTSDLGGKNLQTECYAIKIPDPDPADPDPDPDPSPSPYQYPGSPIYPPSIRRQIDESSSPSPDQYPGSPIYLPSIRKRQIASSSRAKEKEKGKIVSPSEADPPSVKEKEEVKIDPPSEADPPSVKAKENVKIDPPSAKANEKGTIETELLHPFSVGKMMYQSTQHAFLYLVGQTSSRVTHLFSLGGLAPVGTDSDVDGVWSLEVNRPDAGWEEVPRMNFPNRYNPQSVALRGKLCVLGGFSRSQFPAEAAAKGVGWMEAYDFCNTWRPLPNPPSGFSFHDDPLIFTALDTEGKILIAQYNHVDKYCDSARFYVYDDVHERWTTLKPSVRKLLARYPDRTGRRSVAVGNTLYWGLFEDEDINVQAYDLNKDIWFHGSFNIRPVLEKDEFLADNVFPASPPLLHLANQKFCLFLLTSICDEKTCEVSNLYLNCLILDVSPINDEGDNHQHDYYDHVCYKVHGDVNVDDKEDNANYHVHPHDHFWRLSISIVSIQKYPLVNPIQLLDAGFLRFSRSGQSRWLRELGSRLARQYGLSQLM